jgi:hypothetical protein
MPFAAIAAGQSWPLLLCCGHSLPLRPANPGHFYCFAAICCHCARPIPATFIVLRPFAAIVPGRFRPLLSAAAVCCHRARPIQATIYCPALLIVVRLPLPPLAQSPDCRAAIHFFSWRDPSIAAPRNFLFDGTIPRLPCRNFSFGRHNPPIAAPNFSLLAGTIPRLPHRDFSFGWRDPAIAI